MLSEINNELNVRFSTFDIISAIKYLSNNSKNNKGNFQMILKKYL